MSRVPTATCVNRVSTTNRVVLNNETFIPMVYNVLHKFYFPDNNS